MKFNLMLRKGFSVVEISVDMELVQPFMSHPTYYTMEIKILNGIKPGMTFTIEPMINAGKFDVKMLNDGWTAVTKDKYLSHNLNIH